MSRSGHVLIWSYLSYAGNIQSKNLYKKTVQFVQMSVQVYASFCTETLTTNTADQSDLSVLVTCMQLSSFSPFYPCKKLVQEKTTKCYWNVFNINELALAAQTGSVWFSVDSVGHINKITSRWIRRLLRWVTIRWYITQLYCILFLARNLYKILVQVFWLYVITINVMYQNLDIACWNIHGCYILARVMYIFCSGKNRLMPWSTGCGKKK